MKHMKHMKYKDIVTTLKLLWKNIIHNLLFVDLNTQIHNLCNHKIKDLFIVEIPLLKYLFSIKKI